MHRANPGGAPTVDLAGDDSESSIRGEGGGEEDPEVAPCRRARRGGVHGISVQCVERRRVAVRSPEAGGAVAEEVQPRGCLRCERLGDVGRVWKSLEV